MDHQPSFRRATEDHIDYIERLMREYRAANSDRVYETLPGPSLREVWLEGKLFTYINHKEERYLVYIESDPRRPCYTVTADRGEAFDMETFKHSEHADPTFAERVVEEIMRQSAERAAYDDASQAKAP